MGYDTELRYGDWSLIFELLQTAGCSDEQKLTKIMEIYGIHADKTFWILLDEDDQGEGPISELTEVLEEVFETKEGTLFDILLDNTEAKAYPNQEAVVKLFKETN